jgi:hypothetical protein
MRVLNFGEDMAEPQRAFLDSTAAALRWNVQASACDSFGPDGWCTVSVVGQTQTDSDENSGDVTSAQAGLTVARQIDAQLHAGGFVTSYQALDVGPGLELTSQTPIIGGFVGYSEQPDGTGLQGRIAAAFQNGTAEIARSNILGTALETGAEAELRATALTTSVGFGTRLNETTVFTPYLGVTMTQAARLAYSEDHEVEGMLDEQFSYDTYESNQVTAVLGFGIEGEVSADLTYRLGAAIERDVSYELDAFVLEGEFGKSIYGGESLEGGSRTMLSAGLDYRVGPNNVVTLDGLMTRDADTDSVDLGMSLGYRVSF